MTVLEDYQINDVPGFGTLKAGVLETRPAALAAALDPAAKIEFIRIKNSWGTGLDPSMTGNFMGYYDLHLNYLNGPIRWTEGMTTRDRTPLSTVVMPPGF